jgi:hypothetical protein
MLNKDVKFKILGTLKDFNGDEDAAADFLKKLLPGDAKKYDIQTREVISDTNEIPRPLSFRRGLVFGVGFSLFLISIITAINMWEYFINKSPNISEISLLIFSAWGISYVVFLSFSFLLVVIKRLPGCVWTAINQASDLYKNGSLKSKIHICEDSVYNARLDKMQEKNGISANLLKTESARSWIIGLLLLLVLVYFLIIDLFSLFVELILIGLFSSIYFLYERTIHNFSINKKNLTGEGDYPGLILDYLRALIKRS